MAYFSSKIRPLSQCIQYTEGFRPEGIKAYSILDTHWITRMTMGAIIGKGPNKADPHRHEDLYQWYYGMPGTKSFTVLAMRRWMLSRR